MNRHLSKDTSKPDLQPESKIDLSMTLDSVLMFSARQAVPEDGYRTINDIRAERSDISPETRERWKKSAERQKEARRNEASREEAPLDIDDKKIRQAGAALVQRIYDFDPAI